VSTLKCKLFAGVDNFHAACNAGAVADAEVAGVVDVRHPNEATLDVGVRTRLVTLARTYCNGRARLNVGARPLETAAQVCAFRPVPAVCASDAAASNDSQQ